MMKRMMHLARTYSHVHRSDGSPNIFLFSTPRSGSTWLMELIWSQPGFKFCNEPLNIRDSAVAQKLGISRWQELYSPTSNAAVERYFRALCDGKLRFKDPSPFYGHYRPITRRIVFKEIHAGHDRINWFRNTFNGRVVYLVRHPIAVSISREAFPTLDALLHGSYRRHFSEEQLQFAEEIAHSGTKLELGVVAWCLQNAVPLKNATEDWAVVTYEQLILDPHPVIRYLAEKLHLPKPERMLERLRVPSLSEWKSDAVTRSALEYGTKERPWLVDKWRERVSGAEERRSIEILERFGVDIYRFGTSLPVDSFWVSPRSSTGA